MLNDPPKRNAALMAAMHAFSRADLAWHNALIDAFGKAASERRYLPEGRGLPGTPLRAAYDARDAARREWEALR